MMGFIHTGSEITTWMGYSFKTKSTNSKAAFLRQEHPIEGLILRILK